MQKICTLFSSAGKGEASPFPHFSSLLFSSSLFKIPKMHGGRNVCEPLLHEGMGKGNGRGLMGWGWSRRSTTHDRLEECVGRGDLKECMCSACRICVVCGKQCSWENVWDLIYAWKKRTNLSMGSPCSVCYWGKKLKSIDPKKI